MKILIIEDEENAAKRLIKLINNSIDNAEILAVLDSVEESIKWFNNNTHPELIFLDIQLSDGLSFNIFKQVNINTSIIFTTAFDEYTLKAFELNSIDYLLKPINEDKLSKSLIKYNTLKEQFSNTSNIDSAKLIEILTTKKSFKTRFLVNKGDSLEIVDINNIAYFYSQDKYVNIVTKNNKNYLINDSLEKIEQDIEPELMYRINRQFLISVESIEKIHNHFNYKLKLDLNPKPELDAIVSRTKVSSFKGWVSRG